MNRLAALTLSFLVACQGGDDGARAGGRGDPAVDECGPQGESQALVLSRITLGREVEGVAQGFDLDGETSTDGGATGCGIADQVSPEGVPGIDNAFSRLLPALELTEAAALETITEEAIHAGALLVMVGIDRVDDGYDDACLDLSVTGALGVPMVGANDELLPYQTFTRDPEAETSHVPDASLVGGVIEDGPVDLLIPFVFLDADIVFHLHDAHVRLERTEDDRWHGMLGGGLEIQDLIDLAKNTGIAAEVEVLLEGLLPLAADLNPGAGGQCSQISIVLEFEAIPAFFYQES